MLSAKKFLEFLIPVFLLNVFLVIPAFIYLSVSSNANPVLEYSYKFNEVTLEGYPAVIDFIKKEAGYEDTGINKLSNERNFVSNSKAWTFELDEQFITVYLFDSSESAQAALSGFSLKGYKYIDPFTKETARLLWEHNPDFYMRESIVVIYSGQSKEIGRIIEKQMGNPISVPAL